jgi:hypothetical protein
MPGTLPVSGPSTPPARAGLTRQAAIRRAQIFAAVLGASNYTRMPARRRQTAADWHRDIDAPEFAGGCRG